MAVQKPQKPLEVNGQEIYPLTNSEQVITENGERLNAVLRKTAIPDYTAADYGKTLTCGDTGLIWADAGSAYANVEGVSF